MTKSLNFFFEDWNGEFDVGADVSPLCYFPNKRESSSSPSSEARAVEWGLTSEGMVLVNTASAPLTMAATQESMTGSFSFWRGGRFKESSLWIHAWKGRPLKELMWFMMGSSPGLLVTTACLPGRARWHQACLSGLPAVTHREPR